jgi:Tfp pilus assembly protein PilN
MIEINLLPGARKRTKRAGGPKLNFGAVAAAVSERVKDRWLAAAVICGLVSTLTVGTMYYLQSRTERDLTEKIDKGLADSTRFAANLKQRLQLETKRDTLLKQLNIIRAIDGDRFVWPHILDEISRNLPPYTWLTNVTFTGTPQGSLNVAASPGKPPESAKPPEGDSAKAKAASHRSPRMQTDVPLDTVHVRITGRTVDVQALTLYIEQLGASPFLSHVSLDKSEMATEANVQVTDFVLTAVFTRPDSAHIQRVRLSVSVQ